MRNRIYRWKVADLKRFEDVLVRMSSPSAVLKKK